MKVNTCQVLATTDAMVGQETGLRAYLLSGGDEKFPDARVQDWQTKVAFQEIALMKDPATKELRVKIEVSGAAERYRDGVLAKATEIAYDGIKLFHIRQSVADEVAYTSRRNILVGSGILLVIIALSLRVLNKGMVVPLSRITVFLKRRNNRKTAQEGARLENQKD